MPTFRPDPVFMQEALELASKGLEGASPNPLVGAVVVRRGRVIGRGYHRRHGGPHAEQLALRDAGRCAGADLYVTLEPCAHHGKTPPCCEAVLEAGVQRVIYAASDPNPLTRGKGPRWLRRRGVEVHSGLLRREALSQNAPTEAARRPPFVETKQPLDCGQIVTRFRFEGDGGVAHRRIGNPKTIFR